MKVGVVGLGAMGRPMAVNLVGAGFDVWVCDTDPEPVADLVKRGASSCGDPVEMAQTVDIAIMMLPSPAVVREVGELLITTPGPCDLVIDMSTTDPATDEALAEIAAEHGVATMDAPVSRAVQKAWDGELLIMAGGRSEDLERARPLFEAMGSDIHHCGPLGAGHKVKLLNNLKIMTEVDLIAEVLRLARRDGLDVDVVERILSTSSAGSFMWNYQARRMVDGDFVPGFTVSMGLKDLTLGLAWAEQLGLGLPLAAASRDNYQRGVDLGLGDLDTAALVSPEMESS